MHIYEVEFTLKNNYLIFMDKFYGECLLSFLLVKALVVNKLNNLYKFVAWKLI